MWAAITAGVVIVALAIALPLALIKNDDKTVVLSDVAVDQTSIATSTTSTSVAVTTTASTATTASSATTTSLATTTSTAAPITTTTPTKPAGASGDSAGSWAAMSLPALTGEPQAVAVSDQAMLIQTGLYPEPSKLFAYIFSSKKLVELPVDAPNAGSLDIDGLTAVWWEGEFDEASSVFVEEHVYAYRLPAGPKVELAQATGNIFYPQISGSLVTWVESQPWDQKPDEYEKNRVFAVALDQAGKPAGAPLEIVPGALAFIAGDSGWTYSLSGKYVAWEQAETLGDQKPGSYLTDLDTLEAETLGSNAWRPSVGGDFVAYWNDGLKMFDVESGSSKAIDAQGDFPSAASTFVAYYRSVQKGDSGAYQIVARGITGQHEQVLAEETGAPWLSASIAVSDSHVALVGDDKKVYLFAWQPES